MMLAQLGIPGRAAGGGADAVPRLADPSLFSYYLFENPWPTAIGVVIVAAVVLVILDRRGRRALGARVMFAGIALACAVLMIGYLVTTEREVLRQDTAELVRVTAAADTPRLGEFLTNEAQVGTFSPHIVAMRGRQPILDAVRSRIAEFGPLESFESGFVQAVVDGPNIARTQVRVWVRPRKDLQFTGAPLGMWFRIEWRREGQGQWRATAITVMQIDGLGVNGDMGRE